MSTPPARPARGVGALGAQSFDALAALGGWRGVTESVAPTLVFVLVLAARPSALLAALGASLALSALALAARLLRHEPPTQAVGGAALAALSAAWAWHSGSATDFYATGPLGAARLALGVPLFALTLWLIWLLVGPAHHAAPDTTAP